MPSPPLLRRALDALYLLGGIAGALMLAAIGGIIAVQVALRVLGAVLLGADDLSAFAVAAAGTLPLAHAFRHGAHIRVDLVLGRLRGRARFALETLALLLAAAIAGAFAYSMADLATDSLAFGEVSQGSIAWPLWVPQSLVAIGTGLFALALLDDLVVQLAGGSPSYRRAEAASAVERAAEEI
jgi:TRAP-type C4-dicarboxylate transport system permease small subunit